MAEPGLVTSFLESFQRVSEMERERKRDRQMQVQQAVDNALRQHQQEIESERLKQTGEHQRILEQQGQERLRTAEERLAALESDKAKGRELSKEREVGRNERAATSEGGKNLRAGIAGGLSPEEAVKLDPKTIKKMGDAAKTIATFANPLPHQAQLAKKTEAEIKGIQARTDLNIEQTKLLHETLADREKERRAHAEYETARATREAFIAKNLPEEYQRKIRAGELKEKEIRTHIREMEQKIAQGGPAGIEARRMAQQDATASRQYATWLGHEAGAAEKAEQVAAENNRKIGANIAGYNQTLRELDAKLGAYNKLPEGQRDAKQGAELMKRIDQTRHLRNLAQSRWDEMNTPDPATGDTELGRITQAKNNAKREYQEALRNASAFGSLTMKTVNSSGGFVKTKAPAGLSVKQPITSEQRRDLIGKGVPSPRSKAEYDKLPKGTRYRAPSGEVLVKQ